MDQAIVGLLSASITFVGTHFALSHPLRAPLVNILRPAGFQIVYSLVALASFGWMVLEFRAAGPSGIALWSGAGDLPWALASLFTLVASVLLVGSFLGNPALPDPRAKALAAKESHGVFQVTRHPMMWSFTLWSASHVLISPTPRSLILCGAIAFLALVGSHLQDSKKAALMGGAWAGWQAKTSYWPRLGGLAKAGFVPWLAGFALWLAATWAHIPTLLLPAGPWRWLVG